MVGSESTKRRKRAATEAHYETVCNRGLATGYRISTASASKSFPKDIGLAIAENRIGAKSYI